MDFELCRGVCDAAEAEQGREEAFHFLNRMDAKVAIIRTVGVAAALLFAGGLYKPPAIRF